MVLLISKKMPKYEFFEVLRDTKKGTNMFPLENFNSFIVLQLVYWLQSRHPRDK